MSESTLLTIAELKSIPQEMLPMPVLSDNLRSFFSWGIKVHEKGCYNHFMWMIHPGVLASQNIIYQKQSVDDYVETCRLKLWHCKAWTIKERQGITKEIKNTLNKPWYRRLYDVPAIFGQLVYCPWLQTPGLDICSDKGKYLKMADTKYNLSHPDPEQVNHWLGMYPDQYEVYGRYVPD